MLSQSKLNWKNIQILYSLIFLRKKNRQKVNKHSLQIKPCIHFNQNHRGLNSLPSAKQQFSLGSFSFPSMSNIIYRNMLAKTIMSTRPFDG